MKIKIHLIALMLLVSGLSITTAASAKATAAAVTTTNAMTIDQQQMRANAIKDRVEEIKAMNISEMSATQRKELRHELKGMNKELRSMDPTVIYISGGALILIIILLIILL